MRVDQNVKQMKSLPSCVSFFQLMGRGNPGQGEGHILQGDRLDYSQIFHLVLRQVSPALDIPFINGTC